VASPTPEDLAQQIETLKSDLGSLRTELKALSDTKQLGEKQLIVTTYTKVIDVQMHFNEMVMRVRNIAVTLILAVFGAAAYSIQGKYFVWNIHIAALIIAFGLSAWIALWIMDLSHFHLLLRGAVKHSEDIETTYQDDALLKNILGMSKKISHASRVSIWGKTPSTAAQKLKVFYALVTIVGVIYMVVVFFAIHKEDYTDRDKPQDVNLKSGELTIHVDQPDRPQVLRLDPDKLTIHIDRPPDQQQPSKRQGKEYLTKPSDKQESKK